MTTPSTERRRPWTALVLLALGAATLSGCQAVTPLGENTPTREAAGSIVAIGHSGLTGFASDQTFSDRFENSWATGTNPDVDSIYQRMLTTEPGLAAFNFAVDGSDVESLLNVQVAQALAVSPPPELIIVQSVDNDIRCDGTDAENYERFRTKLTSVMDALTLGAPDARIFFISQWGTVQNYGEVVAQLNPVELAGDGPCDLTDATTFELLPERVAALQELVDSYHRIVSEVCAGYENCSWDGGAGQRVHLETTDLGPEHQHLNVAGHRKLAEAEWAVLQPILAG